MLSRPLTLFTLALTAGILFSATAGQWAVWALLTGMAGTGGIWALTRRDFWRNTALFLAAGLLGAMNFGVRSRLAADDVAQVAPNYVTLTGVVQSDVEAIDGGADKEARAARLTLAAGQADLPASASLPTGGTVRVGGNVEVRLALHSKVQETAVTQKIPRYGDTLTVRGRLELPDGPRNPGGLDYRTYLDHQGIHSTLFALRPEDWSVAAESGSRANPFLTLAYMLRQAILRHARASFSPDHAAVLSGILLGDRANLPPALRDDFERTGTTHILATAGLHIGMVVGLMLGLFRLIRIPRKPAILLTLLGLLLYIPMTGERAAVTRATLMAAVFLGGILLEREAYLPNALALAALVLLVLNPLSLFEAGFQLSFAIVITIALLLPLLRPLQKSVEEELPSPKPLRAVGRFVLNLFLIALAAQIGSLPLVAYYFHEVSLVGVFANLLIVPFLFPIIALGFLAAGLGFLSPALAAPLDKLLDFLLTYILSVAHAFASPTWAIYPTGELSPVLIVAVYVVLWGGAWIIHRKAKEEHLH